MIRKFAIVAAALAALGFTAQSAMAGNGRHIDPRLKVVALGVGAASTAAYFALNDWKWKWDSSRHGFTAWGAWGATTIGCAALSPMVATAVVGRPLTMREGHVLIGSCVVPIIGGWLVNAAYNANPHWEAPPPVVRVAARKRRAKK